MVGPSRVLVPCIRIQRPDVLVMDWHWIGKYWWIGRMVVDKWIGSGLADIVHD